MKKYLKENKTLLILMLIAAFCIVISVVLLFKYFYFGNGGTKFGSRLDGIENVEIKDDKKSNIESTISASELVESSKITITGKRIDIRIVFLENATLTEAEGIALKSLDNFSDEEKAFYDFEFTLKQQATEKTEGFLIMGAKNVNGSNLVWNNNNSTSSSEEE
ncbi:MAG: hypothetical protein IJ572_00045 [Bacilli bacterium]|nr:hypothetical protein [Bacilli bacterium]